jgi:membrane-bound lytic murein transglycosylase D
MDQRAGLRGHTKSKILSFCLGVRENCTPNFELMESSCQTFKLTALCLFLCFSPLIFAATPPSTEPEEIDEQVLIRRLQLMENRVVKPRYDIVVKGYLNNYLIRNRARTEEILGRRFIYFPIFEDALFSAELPDELKALSIVESALSNRAVSRVGAMGLWQFMAPTARELGLRVDDVVDERRDARRASAAAAVYLKKLHKQFEDWELAIAAYNSGSGRVARAMKRGRGTTYWDIRADLPRETSNYVPAFIAVSYLLEYYDEHGLEPKYPIEEYMLTTTRTVYQDLSFAQIQKLTGLELEKIEFLNPAFSQSHIPASEKGYNLTLPTKVMDKIKVWLDAQRPDAQDKIAEPTPLSSAPEAAAKPKEQEYTQSLNKIQHTVEEGESLEAIAQLYESSKAKILEWNELPSDAALKTGQNLTLHVPKNFEKPLKIERLGALASLPKNGLKTLLGATTKLDQSAETKLKADNYLYHTTERPESIFDIAEKYQVADPESIFKLNNMQPSKTIKAGTKLKIRKL